MVGAMLYQARALKKAGNRITMVIGARGKDHLILVDEAKKLSDELIIATDDGSEGETGLDFLPGLLGKQSFKHVFTIGPTSMQKAISEMTKPLVIPTTVNLFPIMVDGTGMCGGCRVLVGGKSQFACVDGPEFNAHDVNFEVLMQRNRMYREAEKRSLEEYQRSLEDRQDKEEPSVCLMSGVKP